MRIRTLVACAVALSLAGTSPVIAAPKKKKAPPPLCHLVVDEKGDGRASVGGAVLQSPAMDITGADVATGKKTVVVVMRVVTTNTDNDPVAMLGMEWTVSFRLRDVPYRFKRIRTMGQPIGSPAQYTYEAPGGNPKVTETDTEVKWVIDRAAIPDLKKPKSVLTTLAVSNRVFTTNGDSASSLKTYPDMAAHCLKPQ